MQIEVLPSCVKAWRYRYRVNGAKGKQEKVTLGRYPEMSLADARLKRSEYKSIVSSGKSPAKVKQENKITGRVSDTVSDFFALWFENVVTTRCSTLS